LYSAASSRLRLKCDGTRAETTFRLSAKRMSQFKSVGASVQSNTGSRGVSIGGSNGGYTMFRGSVRVLATHSIRQFPLHFPSGASPCAITFQVDSTTVIKLYRVKLTAHITLLGKTDMQTFSGNLTEISLGLLRSRWGGGYYLSEI